MKSLILLFILTISTSVFSQISNEHLNVGDTAPRIYAKDQNGKLIDSKAILKHQKILLVFYRGNWCPYCRKHLASLQENLNDLHKKGVFVMVVSPEKFEKTLETQKKLKTTFSIIHDSGNKIMNAYKVAYKVNKSTVPDHFNFVENAIAKYNNTNNDVLPVPATYLIDTNDKIMYVQYNTDYKIRSDFKALIAQYL
jgi:peroxiredoxin